MNAAALDVWIEWIVAALLAGSGVVALVSAWGLVRMPTFFDRMHAPTLVATLGVWLASGATIVHLSAIDGRIELHAWLAVILIAMTFPITTVLLARAALLRQRVAGTPGTPAPLESRGEPAHDGPDPEGRRPV